MVNKPTHMSRSLINVYINKALTEQIFTDVAVKNIYFSDHGAVRIVIKKIFVDLRSHCFSRFLDFNLLHSVLNMARQRGRKKRYVLLNIWETMQHLQALCQNIRAAFNTQKNDIYWTTKYTNSFVKEHFSLENVFNFLGTDFPAYCCKKQPVLQLGVQ